MNQQKNIILKTLAITMVFFIIVIPSLPSYHYEKVQAASMVDNINTLAVVTLLLASMATAGTISVQQSLSPVNISAIADKINAGGDTLIAGVNNLGNAIKTGADKATVKALASGAVVYGVLQAMQEVLYPSGDVAVISNNYKLFGISGNSACYVSYDETQYNGIPSIYLYKNAGSVSYYGVNNYLGGDCTSIGAISFKILNLSTDVFGDVTGFCISKNVSINGVIVPSEFGFISSSVLTNFLVGSNVYQKSATNIASSASISVPAYLPQTIINNITNYDGISDVVLGLPNGTTYTGDDLLTVDPTTVPIDDPSTPIDPPVEETSILSAILAALAGLLPISLNRDNATEAASQDLYLPGIDSLIKSISDNADAFGNDITSAIDTVIALPTTINDFFAIPESMTIFSPLQTSLSNKVPIVGQMQTGFQIMFNGDTRPLIINYPAFGEERQINLNWYEPIREQVRGGLGLIFRIALALAIFGMVSSIFNINGIGRASGQIARGANRGEQ